MNKAVVIGGGNGTSTLLGGLKDSADVTAIVSMADDGGSTGRLRRELDVSAAGDVRQCLVALSDKPDLQKIFSYRFDAGSLEGHSMGNIFLAAAERTTGNFEAAIETAEKVLGVRGKVLPVTTDKVNLVAEQNDKEVTGVYEIAQTELHRPNVRLEPTASLLPAARKAISEADFVVIAPGNLYGSIAPALVVDGMREALEQTAGKVVYVCNLVNGGKHTAGFKVHDYAQEIERFIGAPALDYVLYNNAALESNVREGESPVTADESELQSAHYKAVDLPLVDQKPARLDPSDKIAHVRSLVRHDARVVAQSLMELS